MEELTKARAKVSQFERELVRSCDAAAEVTTLKAQLEAAQDQERTATALAVSEFLAFEEMTKSKGSSYDVGVRDFMYTVATKQLNWDLSFLGTKLSAMVEGWCASLRLLFLYLASL